MNRQSSWGMAAVIAIVAAVGLSSQSTRQPEPVTGKGTRSAHQATLSSELGANEAEQRACSEVRDLLRDFLDVAVVPVPSACDGVGKPSASEDSKWLEQSRYLKFVIATVPDPLHTHFPLLFDRVTEAIQEAAQDEQYAYDSSWFPWETEEASPAFLADQDTLSDRKKKREAQPGVLLFRETERTGPKDKPSQPYREGLVVFVVGEEPTRGIHRDQFENAAAWIMALDGKRPRPVAILGPMFSGSLPSLAELLASPQVHRDLKAALGAPASLKIYSGSTTDDDAVNRFVSVSRSDRELMDLGISFHSFLRDDDYTLKRFCHYLKHLGIGVDPTKIAILSEDDTAYGNSLANEQFDPCPEAARLYYPRDISGLRSAYQAQSIFNSGSPQQSGDPARTKLSTDLADPAGEQHDTIRTYAGYQTPLSQEAELLGIVGVLGAKQTQYIVLRSSNPLDQVFLANFLRRNYPQARIVILGADLLFQRERGSTGLSGVMTLSTYPLLPWGQDWTGPKIPSHRVFPDYTAEPTYIATRLLVGSKAFLDPNDSDGMADCILLDDTRFVPAASCDPKLSLPDYGSPYWIPKWEDEDLQRRPPVWLSVSGRNGFWPVAVFGDWPAVSDQPQPVPTPLTFSAAQADSDLDSWLRLTLSMKLALIALGALCIFHLSCCCMPSFTAKPAFRAHFASSWDWRHPLLVCAGSFQVAMAALILSWGSGPLLFWHGVVQYSSWARVLLSTVIIASGFSTAANNLALCRLRKNGSHERDKVACLKSVAIHITPFVLLTALCCWMFIWLESKIPPASQPLVHWRAMHLGSGVSPIIPFLALTLGLYMWFWYSLHGLALFGPDRPVLPYMSDLALRDEHDHRMDLLRMFSQEDAAVPTERTATPLAKRTLITAALLFVIFPLLIWGVSHNVPIRTLGLRRYAFVFCIWLDLCISLLLAEACQLVRTWCNLRRLLVFLDRIPLRRTLGSLDGYSWSSVWKMSGNVLEVRYKLLSRQLESMNHLIENIAEFSKTCEVSERQALLVTSEALKDLRNCGRLFGKWYCVHYMKPNAGSLKPLEEFQKTVASTVGKLWVNILLPTWRAEKGSLMMAAGGSDEDQKKLKSETAEISIKPHIRNAEELVCLTYLGFIQNVLGRMRTLVMGMLWVFIAMTLSISSYPFDPRPAVSATLIVLFVVLGAVISLVYAGIHRDATLSRVTNKIPGELGGEFWFKVIGLGLGPLIGLLTTVFPELSDFLFAWLQPSMSAFK